MRPTLILVTMTLLGGFGCETENPTMVVVDNDYPAFPDGGDPMKEVTVLKVWWVSSLLADAVGPGGEGQLQRAVPNTDYAYALLAPAWDPSSPGLPTRLVAVRSAVKLGAARGDTLHIHVSDDTFVGNCAAGKPLSQDDGAFVTQRIFPGEFTGMTYEASTCTVGPEAIAPDAATIDAAQSD